jgi:hypothetical protein
MIFTTHSIVQAVGSSSEYQAEASNPTSIKNCSVPVFQTFFTHSSRRKYEIIRYIKYQDILNCAILVIERNYSLRRAGLTTMNRSGSSKNFKTTWPVEISHIHLFSLKISRYYHNIYTPSGSDTTQWIP